MFAIYQQLINPNSHQVTRLQVVNGLFDIDGIDMGLQMEFAKHCCLTLLCL